VSSASITLSIFGFLKTNAGGTGTNPPVSFLAILILIGIAIVIIFGLGMIVVYAYKRRR
jgi:hypothetical protein